MFFHIFQPSYAFEIKIVLYSRDYVVTTLDSFSECKIYQALGFSDLDCSDTNTIKTFALLFVLRERFGSLIGFSDEISEIVLKDKKINLNPEKLSDIGFSPAEIQDRARNIYAFSQKVKKMIGFDISDVIDFSHKYVLYGENFAGKYKEEEKIKADVIYNFVKAFLPPDLKYYE